MQRVAYPTSSNETDFLTGYSRAGDGRGFSDVLECKGIRKAR